MSTGSWSGDRVISTPPPQPELVVWTTDSGRHRQRHRSVIPHGHASRSGAPVESGEGRLDRLSLRNEGVRRRDPHHGYVDRAFKLALARSAGASGESRSCPADRQPSRWPYVGSVRRATFAPSTVSFGSSPGVGGWIVWRDETVSVVLMTYAEKGSIRRVIDDFFATGVVDEVVVINNNAEVGTSEEVAKTVAREIFEPRQGYGFATRRGLAEATGDIVVLAEPDGTFDPGDVIKLLAYVGDCDAVFGTRTTRALIWREANMGTLLRFGNWAVAKYVRLLFRSDHFSDVGCTYRLLRRPLVERIIGELR